MKNYRWKYPLWTLLGAVCFFVAQPLIRFPLLNYLQGTADFAMFSLLYPIAALIFLGFSAGIFEEMARFLFKMFFLKPIKCPITQPVLFGLGHGLMEAVVLFLPLFMSGYSIEQLWLGLVERGLAILLHIALTIIVWNGFQTNKRMLYLIAAITLHGLVNSVLVSLQMLGMSAIHVELLFGVIVLLTTVYVVHSRKFYTNGGNENERTESEI